MKAFPEACAYRVVPGTGCEYGTFYFDDGVTVASGKVKGINPSSHIIV
jgi:hypothetical protein